MPYRQTVNLNLSMWTRNFFRRLTTSTVRAAQQHARKVASNKDTATLFIADTRPAMLLGVPHILGTILIMVFGEAMIFFGPLYAIMALVLPWIIARIVVRQDYNMPRILMLWLQTKAFAFESFAWYGSSPSPFPVRSRRKYPRGIWRSWSPRS